MKKKYLKKILKYLEDRMGLLYIFTDEIEDNKVRLDAILQVETLETIRIELYQVLEWDDKTVEHLTLIENLKDTQFAKLLYFDLIDDYQYIKNLLLENEQYEYLQRLKKYNFLEQND